jgi:hypothetical protein
MFSVKIFPIHSWEYISWKWSCLIEIWITWFQKELAIPHFQIPHMRSQKELWKSDLNLVSQGCQHKKNWKFTPRIRTQDPCNSCKYFDIGPPKPDTLNCWCEDPTWGNKSAKPVKVTGKNESLVVLNGTNIDMWELLVSALMVKWQKTCHRCRGLRGQIHGVKFFSWWHSWEPRFKSGFHNLFWDLVVPDRISWMTLEIYKLNLGTSFG